MSAAKQPPAPNTNALDRAAADVRAAAAELRELVAQADAVTSRLAAIVGSATVLMGQIVAYQKAQRLLLDVHDRLTPASNGSTDVH